MEYVQVCPKCKSTNVDPDLRKDMVAWGGSTGYECNNCGHASSFFPEIPVNKVTGELKTVKEKLKPIQDNENIVKNINYGKIILWASIIIALITITLFLINFS